MISIWTLSAVVVVYLLALFFIAFVGDKKLEPNAAHPWLYSLGLGVHCTSWAFFGTTTQAAQFGWPVVPTYTGIIIVMVFMFPVLKQISALCRQHNISSLAEFIALRYNGSHLIAALITILCFIGVVPYIALQLDAITKSINLLAPGADESSNTMGLYVAALMALFAILFGTRTLSLKEKHPGLLLTIAVESVIKLAGLTMVGWFVCYELFDGPLDIIGQAATHSVARQIIYADNAGWIYASHVLLGVCSMFVLPRQFHMNFVENNADRELHTARWLFPLYLLAITAFILPIALAGSLLLDTRTVPSDLFVLALPLQSGNTLIALIAFVGGLSATTSMIIVATLALGIMIANNLVTPLWLKIRLQKRAATAMKASGILSIRRLTVLVVLTVAYWYHLNISQSAPLVKSGIVAIALVSQMFPAMLFGLYWPKRSVLAAGLAILAGLISWIIGLLYPSLLASYYFDQAPTDAQMGMAFVVSLAINCLVFVMTTLLSPTRPQVTADPGVVRPPSLTVNIADLLALSERVLEGPDHRQLSQQLSGSQAGAYASDALLGKTERLLANQVGVPSARILLAALAERRPADGAHLVDLVEEATHSFQFNHELLQSSVQHIQQGISVLDQQLCLLAWNDRYVDLFTYPAGYLQVGIGIQDLLRYNAERGLLGQKHDVDSEISKRIAYMQAGHSYQYVRHQPDGRVIELNGSPLPGGGYVTTYSDITAYINIQNALESAKAELEVRVEERTRELQHARAEAEQAHDSKSRFLAAAGHDLMQPFNAATLFASLLAQKTAGSELQELSEGVTTSLKSAENLLSMLLDMTRLESGVLVPQRSHFALADVLSPLIREFAIISEQKGLQLDYVPTSVIVYSDPRLLRRILQNLLSNAVRYTRQGRILIGCRRTQDHTITVWVCDTGPGIAADKHQAIFTEFHQLEQTPSQGLGLGLTIVERISHLLQHPVSLTSTEGLGTGFCVTLPRSDTPHHQPTESSETLFTGELPVHNKHILVIENDVQIARAMQRILENWGAQVTVADSQASALEQCPQPPNLMIVDYHLDSGSQGTKVANALRDHWQQSVPGILNTANRDPGIREEADQYQLIYVPKPVKPLALKRALRRCLAL